MSCLVLCQGVPIIMPCKQQPFQLAQGIRMAFWPGHQDGAVGNGSCPSAWEGGWHSNTQASPARGGCGCANISNPYMVFDLQKHGCQVAVTLLLTLGDWWWWCGCCTVVLLSRSLALT